jgi:hypothetical protein
MGHIATVVVQLDPSQAHQAKDTVDTSGLGGSLSAALAGVISYLSGALQSLNPAVKLEAAKVLLRMSSTSECKHAGKFVWGTTFVCTPVLFSNNTRIGNRS